MLVPARNTNAGAQKWVIQRVRNTPGSGPPAGTPAKTRTWSMAIRIMTAPRIRSMETTRGAGVDGPSRGRASGPAPVVGTASGVAIWSPYRDSADGVKGMGIPGTDCLGSSIHSWGRWREDTAQSTFPHRFQGGCGLATRVHDG